MAGFVVFSVLGYMAVKQNKSVDEVAKDGKLDSRIVYQLFEKNCEETL